MKKFYSASCVLLLSLAVLFGSWAMPITAYATEKMETETMVETRMTYIMSYSTQLSISETGVASVYGSVRGKSGATNSYVKCTLQRSVGGGWVDVISWEDVSSNPNATVAVDYQLSSRGTYRVYMECRVNTEEKTGTSAYRTY